MKKWLRELSRIELGTDAGKANLIGFAILAFLYSPLPEWAKVILKIIWITLLPNEPFLPREVPELSTFLGLAVVLVVSVLLVSLAEKRR